MAAALRQLLILEMDTRGACALEQSYRALHVERLAEASVGVAQEWQARGRRNPPRFVGKFAGGYQAHVWKAQRGRKCGAREINRLKTELLGKPAHKCVEDTRDGNGLARPRLAQAPARRGVICRYCVFRHASRVTSSVVPATCPAF